MKHHIMSHDAGAPHWCMDLWVMTVFPHETGWHWDIQGIIQMDQWKMSLLRDYCWMPSREYNAHAEVSLMGAVSPLQRAGSSNMLHERPNSKSHPTHSHSVCSHTRSLTRLPPSCQMEGVDTAASFGTASPLSGRNRKCRNCIWSFQGCR